MSDVAQHERLADIKFKPERLVPDIKSLNPGDIRVSGLQNRTWKWNNPDGTKGQRTQQYAEVYHGTGDKKLIVALELEEDADDRRGLRCINGVQLNQQWGKGWMTVNLPKSLSEQIKSKIDDTIFNLIYQRRESLLKRGKEMTEPVAMKVIYNGLVKAGEEKPDGSGDRWDDQITLDVPVKRDRNRTELNVDEEKCCVEDPKGNFSSWKTLQRSDLLQVVIQIDKVLLGNDIRVKGSYRLVVSKNETFERIVTKRKLMQRMESSPDRPVKKIAT